MLRDNCNEEELAAHKTLDEVRAGFYVPYREILRALFVLGDGVGLVSTKD